VVKVTIWYMVAIRNVVGKTSMVTIVVVNWNVGGVMFMGWVGSACTTSACTTSACTTSAIAIGVVAVGVSNRVRVTSMSYVLQIERNGVAHERRTVKNRN
jgi:hypothetical protein